MKNADFFSFFFTNFISPINPVGKVGKSRPKMGYTLFSWNHNFIGNRRIKLFLFKWFIFMLLTNMVKRWQTCRRIALFVFYDNSVQTIYICGIPFLVFDKNSWFWKMCDFIDFLIDQIIDLIFEKKYVKKWCWNWSRKTSRKNDWFSSIVDIWQNPRNVISAVVLGIY